jgi:hypothetical protein
MLCALAAAAAFAAGKPAPSDAPIAVAAPPDMGKEVFKATASVKPEGAPMKTAAVTITIDRWTTEAERDEIAKALQDGGTGAVRAALEKMKETGSVEIGKQRVSLKFAYQRSLGGGMRLITLGADKPLFFLGPDAKLDKPKEGYDVALIDLTVDGNGKGDGSMAAAAKLKVGPQGGLVVDDFSSNMIKLDPVAKEAK